MLQFFVIPNDFRDPVWAPFGDLWRPFGELASQIRGARFPRGSHDSPWGELGSILGGFGSYFYVFLT